MSDGHDGWDAFDWATWGEREADEDARSTSHEDASGKVIPFPGVDRDEARDETAAENAQPRPGAWVTRGGILHWDTDEGSDDLSPSAEAESVWASDNVELPLGAPDALRIRAVHAWLLRERATEGEAIGMLLVERRRIYGESAPEGNPLDEAIAEHQAAMEEYEAMAAELTEIAEHSGPALTLVEFHLWLTEQLAQLAMAPEADPEVGLGVLLVQPDEPDERVARATGQTASSAWRGCAGAVMQARRRVEQVTAPEPED